MLNRTAEEDTYGSPADWRNYTEGFAIGLKAINNTLADPPRGEADLYSYFDTIFETIHKICNLSPDSCQEQVNEKIRQFLLPYATDKRLNKLIILMVYHLAYREWEDTLRHQPVHILIGAIIDYYKDYRGSQDDEQAYIYDMFLVLFDILGGGMRIENALNANCPIGTYGHSHRITALGLPEDAHVHRDERDRILIEWVEGEVKDSRDYFASVNQVSECVLKWLGHADDWEQDLDRALNSGRQAIGRLKANSFIYATELEAHLQTLVNIKQFGEAKRFNAEHFKVIYCFPFKIRNTGTQELVRLGDDELDIHKLITSWQSASTAEDKFLEAVAPRSQEEVELTDVWATPPEMEEAGRNRPGKSANAKEQASSEDLEAPDGHYRLRAINFPDIVVHEVNDADRTVTFHCEIRLSALGNHYVRLSAEHGEVNDFEAPDSITHHDIHRMLRRASSLCGKEPISIVANGATVYRNFRGPEGLYGPEGNLMDVVKQLIRSFNDVLERHAMRAEHDVAKTSNVIVSLSEFDSGQSADPKLEEALYRIFINHIGGPADRLEPWLSRSEKLKRDGRHTIANLAQGELGDKSVIYITANTTLIRLPSHANFVRLDYEQMAEFVATLEPLYADWNEQVSGKMGEVIETLDGPSVFGRLGALFHRLLTGDRAGVAALMPLRPLTKTGRMGKQQIDLQKSVASAKKAMLAIESPRVVTNEVYRNYLDSFIKASSVGTLKREFQEVNDTAQTVVNTVTDFVRGNYQFWVTVLLTIVGILIGLGQLTDVRLICIGRDAAVAGCFYHIGDTSKSKTGDNPNNAADRNSPERKAPSLPDRIEATPLSR